MNDYTKGILTGASLILCFFMFVSAKSQSKNLGHITVNSVSVVNDKGEKVIRIATVQGNGLIITSNADGNTSAYFGTSKSGGGALSAHSADGTQVATLGTGEDGGEGGFLSTFDTDGKRTVYLGSGVGGGGLLRTFNKDEVMTGYFGTDKDSDGIAILLDRYGEAGWSASGKK